MEIYRRDICVNLELKIGMLVKVICEDCIQVGYISSIDDKEYLYLASTNDIKRQLFGDEIIVWWIDINSIDLLEE